VSTSRGARPGEGVWASAQPDAVHDLDAVEVATGPVRRDKAEVRDLLHGLGQPVDPANEHRDV
jgi:hypothetical protein